jgi:cellulose synthase/poly-beta-1,6-N-acetylglucosamine synthase-like glycosyltransferase
MLILEVIVLATMLLGLLLSGRQLLMACRIWLQPSDTACLPATDNGSGDANLNEWPTVTIVVPAHNEDTVIAGCVEAMLALDYPGDRLTLLIVNDRSTDDTGLLADAVARRDPRVQVLHRSADARPGKSAAIADAMRWVTSDLVVLFDADYLPDAPLLKQLVTPFGDRAVGATMGRVVPYNADTNVLTKLLDMERRAGYAVDQHARAILKLVPQFGGTVGGIRVEALNAVGGWREDLLAEDTDLTFRLALSGWTVRYLNDAACYEEVPEDWPSRFRQVRRWAYGHNQCLFSYFASVLITSKLRLAQKLDAILILTLYLFPMLSMTSILATILVLAYGPSNGLLCYACAYLAPLISLAILAPYVQISVAAANDRQAYVLRTLPLLFLSSSLSLIASSTAFILLLGNRLGLSEGLAWDKTRRFRSAGGVADRPTVAQ